MDIKNGVIGSLAVSTALVWGLLYHVYNEKKELDDYSIDVSNLLYDCREKYLETLDDYTGCLTRENSYLLKEKETLDDYTECLTRESSYLLEEEDSLLEEENGLIQEKAEFEVDLKEINKSIDDICLEACDPTYSDRHSE
ncbi:MAG: hypothetical protein Q8Q35_02945 [Nanoarchaeota archaeon]|nr:hypothetical protein [Nanoarchaeota archaeon]